MSKLPRDEMSIQMITGMAQGDLELAGEMLEIEDLKLAEGAAKDFIEKLEMLRDVGAGKETPGTDEPAIEV